MTPFNVLLFENAAPLDVFGPVQVFAYLEKIYTLQYFSEPGGPVRLNQNLQVATLPLGQMPAAGVLLIPGGFGTRTLVNQPAFLEALKQKAAGADYVLTVCTGSALLAKTGLLDNLQATSNKMAFDWVKEQNANVSWVRRARWTRDGKYYTSSGVSAGMDMALGFVQDTLGAETAEKISRGMEYLWNRDAQSDPFA
jgi:transcriptional regulator GlxA family with amidase domain